MKTLFILFLAFVSKSTFAGELQFNSFSQVVFFLNMNASSCKEILDASLQGREAKPDIESFFFQIPNPSLTYKADNPNSQVNISEITITATSDKIEGGVYQCALKAEEMQALFAKDANQRWLGTLQPGMTLETSKLCRALKCGGVKITTDNAARAFGTVRVVGQEIDSVTGASQPIEATKKITIYKTNR